MSICRTTLYIFETLKILSLIILIRYTQKNFWGADRKNPRSVTGNCNFPVSDQLLIQFGQILPVLDQFLALHGQILLFQTKICPNWTKNWSKIGKLHFLILDLGIFLSTPQKFF